MRSVALSTWSEWSGGLRTSSLSVSVVDPTQPWRDQTALFRHAAPNQAPLSMLPRQLRPSCLLHSLLLFAAMTMTCVMSVPAVPDWKCKRGGRDSKAKLVRRFVREEDLMCACRTDHTNALYLSASGLGKRRGMSCALCDHCVLFNKQC